jgi:hypothetical protein
MQTVNSLWETVHARCILFEKSHVPLRKCLQAIYLTDGGSIPIRPGHIARVLDVSDRNAADMLERLNDTGDASWRCRMRRVSEALRRLLRAALARRPPFLCYFEMALSNITASSDAAMLSSFWA